ncbi:hypothetical protein C8R41DRAFT_931310 [Lentinula lateritia]|uniref:Uncharacterized protein n=1 Tax=Lentinula lateritia TaxID=40482 RepID=A0ABQ8V364_9AGAR|nr:hypothetical protein C8R41DRAFT_931310 [Lentinula lateritia]
MSIGKAKEIWINHCSRASRASKFELLRVQILLHACDNIELEMNRKKLSFYLMCELRKLIQVFSKELQQKGICCFGMNLMNNCFELFIEFGEILGLVAFGATVNVMKDKSPKIQMHQEASEIQIAGTHVAMRKAQGLEPYDKTSHSHWLFVAQTLPISFINGPLRAFPFNWGGGGRENRTRDLNLTRLLLGILKGQGIIFTLLYMIPCYQPSPTNLKQLYILVWIGGLSDENYGCLVPQVAQQVNNNNHSSTTVTPMNIGSEDTNSINVTGQGHGVEAQEFWSGHGAELDWQTLFLLRNNYQYQAPVLLFDFPLSDVSPSTFDTLFGLQESFLSSMGNGMSEALHAQSGSSAHCKNFPQMPLLEVRVSIQLNVIAVY